MEFKDSRLGACGLGWLSFIRLRACGSGLPGGFKGLRVCGLRLYAGPGFCSAGFVALLFSFERASPDFISLGNCRVLMVLQRQSFLQQQQQANGVLYCCDIREQAVSNEM